MTVLFQNDTEYRDAGRRELLVNRMVDVIREAWSSDQPSRTVLDEEVCDAPVMLQGLDEMTDWSKG